MDTSSISPQSAHLQPPSLLSVKQPGPVAGHISEHPDKPLTSSPCAHLPDTCHVTRSPAFHEPAVTELAPIQAKSDTCSVTSLPPLISVTGGAPPRQAFPTSQQHPPEPQERLHYGHDVPEPPEASTSTAPAVSRWLSLNPLTTYYSSNHDQAAEFAHSMERDPDKATSPPRSTSTPASRPYDGRACSVGLDDPDPEPEVRMAAEALRKLRTDFRSPQQQPEPLLSVISTEYPALAAAIERTTSYYNNFSNSSPYLKKGAEYCLTPIANTFGHVSRSTGVEGRVRRYLESNRPPRLPSDLEAGGPEPCRRPRQWSDFEAEASGGRNKRRKMEVGVQVLPAMGDGTGAHSPVEAEAFAFSFSQQDRRASMSTVSTLPPYDENMSPAYTKGALDESGTHSSPVPLRLWHMTPNLRHAISEAGLQSLKYCLQWLNGANNKISRIIVTVRATVDQYDHTVRIQSHHQGGRAMAASSEQDDGSATDVSIKEEHGRRASRGDDQAPGGHAPTSQASGDMVHYLLEIQRDIARTMNGVVSTVSKYAGGAVPENLRVFVRHFIIRTLPTRLKSSRSRDSRQSTAQDQASTGARDGNTFDSTLVLAQRVLVTAGDALDWVGQMSAMVHDIIAGAERWLDAPRDNNHKEQASSAQGGLESSSEGPTLSPLTGVGHDGDAKMSGV